MPIARAVLEMMERSSWIRKMFDEGSALKDRLGAANVFDFTLGNPVQEPPETVLSALKKLVADNKTPGTHRYMPNAGFPDVRARVADQRARETGLSFTADHVVMTCGAGGALNVIIKTLVDPGDEVVIVAPYFAEYLFYIDNHQGVAKIAETDVSFQLNLDELKKTIGPKTKIVLLNSPNNPTGAIYPEAALGKVGELLTRRAEEYGHDIYLVMDEPYKKLTYEGFYTPEVFGCYPNTIVATSHSKDLCLPGERIGYIAVSPLINETDTLINGLTLCNRILGFVNAPALFQRLVAELQDVQPDMSAYTENRKILLDGLRDAGYEVGEPGGGFYLFVKSPIPDEVAFLAELKKQNILAVPGRGFGRAGYFRLSFCVSAETCRNALPGFAETILAC